MTKKQRQDFEVAMQDIKQCAYQDCATSADPPNAWALHDALRILSARLDEIEVMAQRALMHTKGC